ncbi:MAG: nucleoside deaminase [Nitrospira sp.]|nr:nucleoside deaminase [Nitrospira sp.]MCP9442861.1 nucleoside deaminase [Nitrospira sp.]
MRQTNRPLRSDEDRMQFVIGVARANVARRSGGPFAAAVFETRTGRLVSVGANLVVATSCSLAHAELVALANAQHTLRHFDLGAPGIPEHELVTSCEPCAMCFGAIPWSGVRRVLCGARAGDAEAIGFDEGPKPRRWIAALERRGIAVVRDLCRREAVAVLELYRKSGGIIYNARRKS